MDRHDVVDAAVLSVDDIVVVLGETVGLHPLFIGHHGDERTTAIERLVHTAVLQHLTCAVMHIVLVHPEIAPNTGNIIRLCANAGASLHLVEPLGFSLDDKLLKRGGLDYHELAELTVHPDFAAAQQALPGPTYTFSSSSTRRYDTVDFEHDAVFVFGAERSGLPTEVLDEFPVENQLAIPMRTGNRSLNLANAVSVVVYEAWRQHGFAGATATGATTSETPGAPPFDH